MKKRTSLQITIPVYNEEVELEDNILKLHSFCKKNLSLYDWTITIADNASIDDTSKIGKRLANKNKRIAYFRLAQKGRGRAVKKVWRESGADICCYMDVDLSTDLKHLQTLIHSLENGNDIAIGSRLAKKSYVINRSLKREFISRALNMFVWILFQTGISDVQCGFKAVTKEVVDKIIPHIEDDKWFMDSELLLISEKLGYNIFEEPVTWTDNPGSTVRVLPTSIDEFIGLMRLFIFRPWRNLPNLHKDNGR